ncbi:MAG: hypothetical protein PHF63_00025 [Herbinix sp.]|nr:hypothetical protein [Herbinix sp.]
MNIQQLINLLESLDYNFMVAKDDTQKKTVFYVETNVSNKIIIVEFDNPHSYYARLYITLAGKNAFSVMRDDLLRASFEANQFSMISHYPGTKVFEFRDNG